jgi:hypothetical protein
MLAFTYPSGQADHANVQLGIMASGATVTATGIAVVVVLKSLTP